MSNSGSQAASRGWFVTGTDTGVGKTLVTCALLHAFAARGYTAVGMKPVASGAHRVHGRLVNDDVERIVAASSVAAPRRHVNPYCFAPAIAPHIAAAEAGTPIRIDRIARSYRALAALAQVVVVEGVGGFLVPLGPRGDTAQLASRLSLPVILVVGLRLGCLNHGLLAAEAIAGRGLKLAGWVANAIDPGMAAPEANVSALAARLGAPLLARLEFARRPRPARLSAELDIARLA